MRPNIWLVCRAGKTNCQDTAHKNFTKYSWGNTCFKQHLLSELNIFELVVCNNFLQDPTRTSCVTILTLVALMTHRLALASPSAASCGDPGGRKEQDRRCRALGPADSPPLCNDWLKLCHCRHEYRMCTFPTELTCPQRFA